MCSYSTLPAHFTDAKYHRRCGIHVQTLLICHEAITLLVSVAAISIGTALLTHPNLHRKTSLYKQLFHHYARIRAAHYILLYRIAIALWILVHIIHVITTITSILATQLIRPELLYPQLVILVILVGFYTFSLLSVMTMNFIGSSIIWIAPLIASFFCFFTLSQLLFTAMLFASCRTNLYLIVLTHRYVVDRREVLQKILRSTKTVTFKEIQASSKQEDEN